MTSRTDENEKKVLRERITNAGFTVSPNANLNTLRTKWDEIKEQQKTIAEAVEQENPSASEEIESSQTIREKALKEKLKLVRVEINNMNPEKKDISGEFITVGNDVIGHVTKYVPFNLGDIPYHVPQCILDVLEAKQFTQMKIDNKTKEISFKDLDEYNINILPQLTKEELDELGENQRARDSFNDD